MTTFKKIIHWIFIFLPMVIAAAFMPFLEDKVPIHYDVEDKVDGYGSKYTYFVIAVFMSVTLIVIRIVIEYYRRKKYDEDKDRVHALNNIKVLSYFRIVIGLVESIILAAILYKTYIISSGKDMSGADINKIVVIVFGCTIILLGNLMPKTKRNGGIGLRTIWSMHNDTTWTASNRVGGIFMMIGGIITIMIGIMTTGSAALIGMLITFLVITVLSVIYSYMAYKKYKD